jgi:hypothetical protein
LQMLKFGARMVAPVSVEKLIPARSADELHALQLDCGAQIRCRVLLLALGVRWRRLEAAGAGRFAGAGIYYACTTVEADLYDRADVAVVGGGVTLYEACCTGTPAIGVSVVPAQRPTILGFARLGAVRDGGSARHVCRAASEVSRLIEEPALRASVARTGRAVVDGRGARRVAAAVLRLVRPAAPGRDRRSS